MSGDERRRRLKLNLSLGQWLAPSLVIAAVLAAAPFLWAAASRPDARLNGGPPHAPEVVDALMNLDEQRLAVYLEQGWDPNWRLDAEGNDALHMIMIVCARFPSHDPAAATRIARMLVASGADPTRRNAGGYTPLSWARSEVYCGPGHPVAAYLSEIADE